MMIARTIASELDDTEIVRITDTTQINVDDECTRVGLVFPVYYGGLPSLVQKFIPNLNSFKDIYVFAVTTHAGGPGRALSQLRDELQQIGLDLSSGYNLRMPQNYIMAYDIQDENLVNTIITKARDGIPEIVDIVRSKQIRRPDAESPPYSGQSERYHKFIAKVKDTDTYLWCDESCTECGACVRVCPVQNIVLDDGQPRWLHNCEQCLACLNWCPEEAIQYGERTSEKGRYTNPQVTIEELEL